jgi:putative transposase
MGVAVTYDALRRGRFSESGRIYHVTLTTDGRRPVFLDFVLARVAVRHLRRMDELGWTDCLAWVVMPDHLHWLFGLGDAVELARVVQGYKGASAREINGLRGTGGPVWQRGYYDHALRKEEDVLAIARYIVGNPLRAGLAASIGDYPHWDAKWL